MRILIVDDHGIFRRGLIEVLTEEYNGVKIGEAETAAEAIHRIRKEDWDIVILDISLPGRSGLEVLEEAKKARPRLPILILSMYAEDQYAIRALRAGAAGYLTKETVPEKLTEAIRVALSGERYVSPSLGRLLAARLATSSGERPEELLSIRECQVLRMVAAGKTVTQIARELSLSNKTISTYRARILQKTGLKTNAALIRYAMETGLAS